MKHASTFGFETGKLSFDMPKIIDRSRDVASKLSGGVSYLMRKNKVEVIMGNGRQAGGGPNVARQIAYRAGIAQETCAWTVNMACGSGLKSILLGAEGTKAMIRRLDAQPGEATDVTLRIEDMTEAHLVLTDALITESLRRAKQASKALAAELDAADGAPSLEATEDEQPSEPPARGRAAKKTKN